MSGKHLKHFFSVNAGLSYVMRPFEQLELKLNQRTRVCMELIMTNGISYREKGLTLFFGESGFLSSCLFGTGHVD